MEQIERIQPGSVIGILGDGQLGKMLALAAASLGYRVAVLGPGGRRSPAGQVAFWAKAWGDPTDIDEALLDEFCNLVSIVLIEWENVPIDLLQQIEARGIPVRPDSRVLAIAQDRLHEKGEAEGLSIPTAPYTSFGAARAEQNVPVEVPSILKTRRDGYDGKGQARLAAGEQPGEAWEKLGGAQSILEEAVDLVSEISVIVARSPVLNGIEEYASITYGPFENRHEDGILRQTLWPISRALHVGVPHAESTAVEMAKRLAHNMGVHGLLAVEFFVTRRGEVLFNEMAPRPHNSGHLTIECHKTSQFEQYVRAACNLPLGSTESVSAGDMLNLLGGEVHDWCDFLQDPTATLHLYGKAEAKPGRKMGHVTRRTKPLS